jgi:hypothetical protein
MAHHVDHISAGTQVVPLVEVRGTNDSCVRPRGTVDVATRRRLPELPADATQTTLNDSLRRARLEGWV